MVSARSVHVLVLICSLAILACVCLTAWSQVVPPPPPPAPGTGTGAAPAPGPGAAAPPQPVLALKVVPGASQLGYKSEAEKVRLSAQPPAGVTQPPKSPGNRYYGALPLKGRPAALTADVRPTGATFYIDLDGDNDLSNQAEGAGIFEARSARYRFTLPLKASIGGVETTISMMMEGQSIRGGPELMLYNDTYLQGTCKVGEKDYLCAIIDGNTDGDYTDGAKDWAVIDFDGDGKLSASADSAELYQLAEPFLAGDQSYQIVSVSLKDGIKADVSPKQAKPKPYLSPGHPAIDLRATTLDGKTFQLSQLKGYPVGLFFGKTTDQSAKGLMTAMNNYAQTYNKDPKNPQLFVIAIMVDDDKAAVQKFLTDNKIRFPVVFEGAAHQYSRGYRIIETPKSFWLDHEMIIRYRDLYGQRMDMALQDLVPKANEARKAAAAGGTKPEQPKPEQPKEEPAKPAAEPAKP